MLDAAALRSLADLDGPERAFLTIYLDAGDDPSVIDARATRVRALLSDQPAELEHFEESLAMAREMVETHAPTEGALAVFASWAADLRRAYALPEPVGTTLWMGDAPYLRPAAELLDEHETYAAVVLDNTKARIYLVSADEVDEEGRVRGDIKNRVKKGGWSQKRYARRRDKQLETYATELAADLATLDARRETLRPASLDVVAAVESAIEQARPQAEAQGLTLTVEPLAASLPATLDADALGRILAHLVGNAVRYTEVGSVTVEVDADADAVAIRVIDTGIGIPEAAMATLFDGFKSPGQGQGFGLAITQRLVHLMGGTVSVESRWRAGTAVTVVLPRGDATPAEASQPAEALA